MQAPKNKLSIIVMNDTGKTRRYRCHIGVIKTLCAFILALPIITGLACWFTLENWRDVNRWKQEKAQLEQALLESTMQAQSLVHLQALLASSIQPALLDQTKTMPLEKIKGIPEDIVQPPPPIPEKTIESYKSPIKDMRFRLDNVQGRITDTNSLRINVDLFNVASSQILAGTITFSLLYPNGTIQALKTEDSTFRIRRYKKVINTTKLDEKSLQDIAQSLLIAEIHVDKILTYRDYYPIEEQAPLTQ